MRLLPRLTAGTVFVLSACSLLPGSSATPVPLPGVTVTDTLYVPQITTHTDTLRLLDTLTDTLRLVDTVNVLNSGTYCLNPAWFLTDTATTALKAANPDTIPLLFNGVMCFPRCPIGPPSCSDLHTVVHDTIAVDTLVRDTLIYQYDTIVDTVRIAP